ncbi:MAG: type II toxin-antitoxin system RelE/ParE family toxin [Chitinophagales bacterium]|nr:type II toxin-antitoxin system RelE/ParE family toxin [Bacteroidota bacterium]MBK8488934.1 type II toxin-antitoxin system RelE/ParE family toxin [Bacteroidota bacterium]MBK8680782.1 type II toxin-antitoxin system RelE/ParE family toxin [Bacteroidota bacterium]
MARLNWTDQSVLDLINIFDFIAKDSRRFAKITIGKIRDSAKNIRNYPLLGKIVSEINVVEIREVIIGNYRLIYLVVEKDRVDILTVFHSSRLLDIEEFKSRVGRGESHL